MTEIKTILRNARKSRELTLQQVSKLTKIPLTTINSWERGASYPRGKNRDIIAAFYQLPVGSLDYANYNADTDSREFNVGRVTQDMAMAEYETKPIMMHKKHWELAQTLKEQAGDVNFNEMFARLVKASTGKQD